MGKNIISSYEDKLIEQKLKAVKKNNALILFVVLFFLTISFIFMWYIKQYPEKIIKVPVEKIVEKEVEKEIYIKEKIYFIWNDMFVNFQIWETKWEKKFLEMIKLLYKVDKNKLDQKIYVKEIYSVDSNWKKINQYSIKNAFKIRDFIKWELRLIEKFDKNPIEEVVTWTWNINEIKK